MVTLDNIDDEPTEQATAETVTQSSLFGRKNVAPTRLCIRLKAATCAPGRLLSVRHPATHCDDA